MKSGASRSSAGAKIRLINYLAGINGLMLDGDRLRRIAKMLSFVKNDVQRARYVRHYVYFYDRSDSTYVERVLHDRRDETLHIF